MGVNVLQDIGDDFSDIIEEWYFKNNNNPRINANNIPETLETLFDTYPTKQQVLKEEIVMFV